MKIIKDDDGLVIKSWCENPDDGAIAQARNLAKLPFAFKQIALMPDTHQGYGMPIGGVLALERTIIPNAVGVDIGCGMGIAMTNLAEISPDKLRQVIGEIRKAIPVGFSHHKEEIPVHQMPPLEKGEKLEDLPIILREFQKARKQLGTLGGGNHFIEIQKTELDGRPKICLMLHSGSRNIGLQVAKHYNDLAKKLNERWRVSVPREHDLAFLPLETDEGHAYKAEMDYCLKFAAASRARMMMVALGILEEITGCSAEEQYNIHHNYATIENHFGRNLIIHRKGATSAKDGEIGIIPGSQGTASYVIKGKGNVESFMSCSHGAGRKMGRKQAQRTLNLEDETREMNRRGILHSIRGPKDLDEAPGSYKDIDVVMSEQTDLVDVLFKLDPLGVIKG